MWVRNVTDHVQDHDALTPAANILEMDSARTELVYRSVWVKIDCASTRVCGVSDNGLAQRRTVGGTSNH